GCYILLMTVILKEGTLHACPLIPCLSRKAPGQLSDSVALHTPAGSFESLPGGEGVKAPFAHCVVRSVHKGQRKPQDIPGGRPPVLKIGFRVAVKPGGNLLGYGGNGLRHIVNG